MFHRSERLLLRPPWPEDWHRVFAGIADEAVVRNLALAPWPYGSEDAHQFVKLPIDPMFPRFLIARADNAAVVGCVGIDERDGDGELGYWIARQYWGQGYATEAGLAVKDIARMLGHERLTAEHFVDNPASGRVLQKLGFCPTGSVSPRYSRARGRKVPAVAYELDLGEPPVELPQAA